MEQEYQVPEKRCQDYRAANCFSTSYKFKYKAGLLKRKPLFSNVWPHSHVE